MRGTFSLYLWQIFWLRRACRPPMSGDTQHVASQRVVYLIGRVVLGGFGFHPYDLL